MATQTNADILRRIIEPPVLPGLTEKTDAFPGGWKPLVKALLGAKIDTTVN
jgi:hypothetical protein